VVATGRNLETLATLSALGADATVPLGDGGESFEAALGQQFAGDGIEVVLDYLWGPSAERIIAAAARAGKDGVPIRFVHVGAASGPSITLPSAALRSSALTLMGSGIGSIPMDRLVGCVGELLEATVPAGFQIAAKPYPLSDVERVWASADTSPRTVFVME
jgi:NADPH:quinone reductase-like Zn-dependent oxidoreductase